MKKKRNTLRILAIVFAGVICLAGGYIVGSYWGITKLQTGQLLATDSGMSVYGTGMKDAYVLSGEIDYSRHTADSGYQTIPLGKGQMASGVADTFQPIQIPLAAITHIQNKLGLEKLRIKAYRLTIEKAE